ncbi:hypothetical protein B7939_08520 [Eggerthia catenaformis]|nr:hypothetical protein B7939_08520 [Eggerthia catenaformis]
MKKGIVFIISLLLVLNSSLVVGVQAKDVSEMNDKERDEYINEVFDPKLVDELNKKGNKKQVYQAKSLTGSNRGVRAAKGRYPKRKGVILYTPDKYKGVVPLGHAGMVYDKDWIIEALDKVKWGKNKWNKDHSKCYALGVKGTSVKQDAKAGDYCVKQIGKPYNYNYYNMGTRKSFYCSQLVYAAYLDTCGVDLNTPSFDIGSLKAIHPVELLEGPKTTLLYRSS